MAPGFLRRPWYAFLVALGFAFVSFAASPSGWKAWATAAWTGTVVFSVLVGGRIGDRLERHQTASPQTTEGILVRLALFLPLPFGVSFAAPIAPLAFGLFAGRWPERKDVTHHPFGWPVGIAFGFGFFWMVLTGPDADWAGVGLAILSVWLCGAAYYTGLARHVRRLQKHAAVNAGVLLVVGLAGSGLGLPTLQSHPEAILSHVAIGIWAARWWLADPRVDEAPEADLDSAVPAV